MWYDVATNQVPATWFESDAGIRRLASRQATAPRGAVAAVQALCSGRACSARAQLTAGAPQRPLASNRPAPGPPGRRARSPGQADRRGSGAPRPACGWWRPRRRDGRMAQSRHRSARRGTRSVSSQAPSVASGRADARPQLDLRAASTAATCRAVAGARRAAAAARLDGDEPVGAVRRHPGRRAARGDAAVRELTERFDGVPLDDLAVPPPSLTAALARHPGELAGRARGRRTTTSRPTTAPSSTPRASLRARRRRVRGSIACPVDRAGCYVPGGRAPYPSTVLMTAVPARVAGVPEVVLCVPPGRRRRRAPDATLAAAALAGVDEVYRIGGAQAIAAHGLRHRVDRARRRDRRARATSTWPSPSGRSRGGPRRRAVRVRRSHRGRGGGRRHRPGRLRRRST